MAKPSTRNRTSVRLRIPGQSKHTKRRLIREAIAKGRHGPLTPVIVTEATPPPTPWHLSRYETYGELTLSIQAGWGIYCAPGRCDEEQPSDIQHVEHMTLVEIALWSSGWHDFNMHHPSRFGAPEEFDAWFGPQRAGFGSVAGWVTWEQVEQLRAWLRR